MASSPLLFHLLLPLSLVISFLSGLIGAVPPDARRTDAITTLQSLITQGRVWPDPSLCEQMDDLLVHAYAHLAVDMTTFGHLRQRPWFRPSCMGTADPEPNVVAFVDALLRSPNTAQEWEFAALLLAVLPLRPETGASLICRLLAAAFTDPTLAVTDKLRILVDTCPPWPDADPDVLALCWARHEAEIVDGARQHRRSDLMRLWSALVQRVPEQNLLRLTASVTPALAFDDWASTFHDAILRLFRRLAPSGGDRQALVEAIAALRGPAHADSTRNADLATRTLVQYGLRAGLTPAQFVDLHRLKKVTWTKAQRRRLSSTAESRALRRMFTDRIRSNRITIEALIGPMPDALLARVLHAVTAARAVLFDPLWQEQPAQLGRVVAAALAGGRVGALLRIDTIGTSWYRSMQQGSDLIYSVMLLISLYRLDPDLSDCLPSAADHSNPFVCALIALQRCADGDRLPPDLRRDLFRLLQAAIGGLLALQTGTKETVTQLVVDVILDARFDPDDAALPESLRQASLVTFCPEMALRLLLESSRFRALLTESAPSALRYRDLVMVLFRRLDPSQQDAIEARFLPSFSVRKSAPEGAVSERSA